MECVVGLAIAAGIGGREAMSSVVSDDGYWNTERVLSLVSGAQPRCHILWSIVSFLALQAAC